MSSACKHSTVVSSYGDFGYLLGINESGKLRFSCTCITINYVSELFFIIYCYLKGDVVCKIPLLVRATIGYILYKG